VSDAAVRAAARTAQLSFDLYLITDLTLGINLVAATDAALRAVARGRVAVQLRAKGTTAHGTTGAHGTTRELIALARALRITTRSHGALLFVNERADVARIVAADGVHLPEDSLTPSEARAVLGEDALVGVSCHDARGLTLAAEGRATFATLSPFGASPGKGAPVAHARFADLVAGASLPVLALGGVGADDVDRARGAGAHGVAVVRAIYAAADPAAAAADLIRALDSAERARR